VLDVSDESSCLAAVRTVTEKCGRCDVLGRSMCLASITSRVQCCPA
jgi:hypothetical protein